MKYPFLNEDTLVELLKQMTVDSTWHMPIDEGHLEVYWDGVEWSVERVSEDYDECYPYADPRVAAKEILYYYE